MSAKREAIIICGHGSKNKKGVQAFDQLYNQLKQEYGSSLYYGYIEYSKPLLKETLNSVIQEGANHIIVVPAILFTGVHIKFDIPATINAFRNKFPHVTIKLAGYLGINKHLIALACNRINHGLNQLPGIKKKDTNLLLVGVGSSQGKANADIAAITRYIWEESGVNHAWYAFISKMTFPSIESTLQILQQLPQKNIIVLPFLLFPGVYLTKITQIVNDFQRSSDKNIICTNTLETNEHVIDAFKQRIYEVQEGNVNFANNIPDDLQPRIKNPNS